MTRFPLIAASLLFALGLTMEQCPPHAGSRRRVELGRCRRRSPLHLGGFGRADERLPRHRLDRCSQRRSSLRVDRVVDGSLAFAPPSEPVAAVDRWHGFQPSRARWLAVVGLVGTARTSRVGSDARGRSRRPSERRRTRMPGATPVALGRSDARSRTSLANARERMGAGRLRPDAQLVFAKGG